MKTMLLLLGVFAMGFAYAQNDLKGQITKAVETYSNAGDSQDASTLKTILHDQHRLVLNDGSSTPFVMDKAGYIAKIESKEWGGDKRKVEVYDVLSVDGVNATAKALLDGEKASMESFFSLVKVDNEWLIVQELVKATFK